MVTETQTAAPVEEDPAALAVPETPVAVTTEDPRVSLAATEPPVSHPVVLAKSPLRLISDRPALNWAKVEHLLFLPCLDVTRPWQLRYDQGDGLLAVSGIAYRYSTIGQFLNELTRLQIGLPLAEGLCARIVQTRYALNAPLTLYVDGHEKAHWTAQTMPCGRVAMLDRVMPCTHQMVVNDAQGYVLLILDRSGDHHLGHELLTLDTRVERITGRRVELTIADREANSLALAQAYAESDHHHLLTMLDSDQYHGLDDFTVLSAWAAHPRRLGEEVATAIWAMAADHPKDPRCFCLIRDRATAKLCAVYASTLGVEGLNPADLPTTYRHRWVCQENRHREMVDGANLNENYGYQQDRVPNRQALRQQATLQECVAVTGRQLATNQSRIEHHQQRQEAWTKHYAQPLQDLRDQLAERQAELERRRADGQPVRRVQQQVDGLKERDKSFNTKQEQRLKGIQEKDIQPLLDHRTTLAAESAQRQAAVAAVDVDRPMFERNLAKDQIMADLQGLLANLHHWSRDHYFPPEWQALELGTATKMIYNKPGRVVQTAERIDVTLRAYAYRREQDAAEAACRQFNARQIRDLAGRLIQIAVAPFEHSIRRLHQIC